MKNQDILSSIDHQSGMTVPSGYFSDFQKRMAESLPQQPWEMGTAKVMPRSFWQKVRPYAYMAAMFMGIWCMMKMFDIIRTPSSLSIGDNPVLMTAIDNDAFFNDYCSADLDESDLYNDLYEQGLNPAEFSTDN